MSVSFGMRVRGLNLVGAIALVIGCVLGAAGLLTGHSDLLVLGGASVTTASLVLALRLRRWAQRVAPQPRRLQDWEFRRGYLTAVLIAAVLLAIALIDAGRPEIGAWCLPAAMVWFLLAIGRGRLSTFLNEILWPTRTPPRPH